MLRVSVPAGILTVLVALPLAASAHQVATYRIGGEEYRIVAGSLNEPVVVDDKTGVDLQVSKGGAPVENLEKDLKVELAAGGVKRTLGFSPVYGKSGAYYATFVPTVATTYTYRIFGSIGGTPVNLSFTCRANGEEALNDTEEKTLGEGIVQLSRSGGFGCPKSKEEFGFPESAPGNANVVRIAETARMAAFAALAFVAFALVLVLVRRK